MTSSLREKSLKKLYFQCNHRGMREGDLLLTAFAKDHLQELSDDELIALENFLDLPDQDLLVYLLEPSKTPEEYRAICVRIAPLVFKK